MLYVPPTAESILQWQDTRGYRLSDRIWNISEVTATQIDDLIGQALGSGQSAVKLASLLEQFLLPGREFPLTNTPYGTSGSFNARRLARSEITRAHSLASRAANLANPFVTREYYNLSAAHKPDAGDPCELHAATSKAQDGWPVGQAPLPMVSTHPQCVTPGQFVKTIHGNVPIENVKTGDKVLTHTGEYQPVLAAWSHGYSGTVYEIETDAGILELTGEHPVLTPDGWLDADTLEVGDYIVYTGQSAQPDLSLGVSESDPTEFGQTSIAHDVTLPPLMPIRTVSFDSNLNLRDGEVNAVSENSVFSNIANVFLIEGISQQSFQSAFAGEFGHTFTGAKTAVPVFRRIKAFAAFLADTIFATRGFSPTFNHSQPHIRPMHRIIESLAIRVFPAGFGLQTSQPDTVFVNGVGVPHSFAIGFPTLSMGISLPLHSYGLRAGAHGQTAHLEQITQNAVSDTKFGKNLHGCFARIPLGQDVLQWLVELLLKAESMVFGDVDAMGNRVVEIGTRHNSPANGAVVLHDNLSLLSLNDVVGAASRSAVVSGVITPSQAHQHYSIVRSVKERKYSGLVYNMHVETDNTYTVNGAVVHNCICYITSGVMSQNEALALIESRNDLRDETTVFLDPQARQTFVNQLFGLALVYGLASLLSF